MEKEMSEDEYQMKQFFENQKPVCVEKDKDGNCLMSAQWILMDLKLCTIEDMPLYEPKKLFCEEIKTNKNDKTI
jgi:hypothetical protein